MTSIFNTNIGAARKVKLAAKSLSERLILKTKDKKSSKVVFGGDDSPCLVTSYSITAGDSVQFAATLGTELYAYVLGNNPYTLSLEGMLFNASCTESKKPVEVTLKEFESCKASKHKPVQVLLGDIVFTTFLENISVAGMSNNGTDILTFKLTLRGIKND